MSDKRYIKSPASRETIAILGLYMLFFLWWYATAYGFGDDPSAYRYILGFPEWFFYSCIAGYAGISVILWIVVRLFFKNTDIDGDEDNND